MTRDVEIAQPGDTLQTVAKLMADLDVGVLPVGEDDRLVGMITDHDIAVRAVATGLTPNAKVREVMTTELRYCFDHDAVANVADKMTEWQIQRLPVLSRDKRLVGIVSLGDFSRAEQSEAAHALRGASDGTRHVPDRAAAGDKPRASDRPPETGISAEDLAKAGF